MPREERLSAASAAAGLPPGYELLEIAPSTEDYLRLRQVSGLVTRSASAAGAGLRNGLHAVRLDRGSDTVGMGRIIGDGSLFFHLVDVAVDPAHQGRGLGRAIVAALLDWIGRTAPAEAYVSLMANGNADRLYRRFGFGDVLPKARGMELWLNDSDMPDGTTRFTDHSLP